MQSSKILFTLLSVSLIYISAFAQQPSGKIIMQKSVNATQLAGSEALSTLTIIDDKGRERVRKLAMVTKLYGNGELEKKLNRFLAPADVKGTGLLTFDYEKKDDDMWLYMPALRKTRRIISSEKAKRFMGSEFSYSDMTPPNLDEFKITNHGEKEVNGVQCWEIELIPNDDDIADENGFSRKFSYIGKEDYVIRKAVYYDLDEELLKEMEVKEIKEVDTKNHTDQILEALEG